MSEFLVHFNVRYVELYLSESRYVLENIEPFRTVEINTVYVLARRYKSQITSYKLKSSVEKYRCVTLTSLATK